MNSFEGIEEAFGNKIEAANRQAEIDKLTAEFLENGGKVTVCPGSGFVPRPVIKRIPVKSQFSSDYQPRLNRLRAAYIKIDMKMLEDLNDDLLRGQREVVDHITLAQIMNLPATSLLRPRLAISAPYFVRDVEPVKADPHLWLVADVIRWVDELKVKVGA